MSAWHDAHFWRVFLSLGYLLTWLVVPHILLSRKRPVSTLAWIWAVILFPFLGLLAYFLVGAERIKTARYRKRGRFRPGADSGGPLPRSLAEEPEKTLLDTLSAITQLPPTSASSLELLVDAATFYPALLGAIEGAEHHLHVMFYIWREDEYGRQFLEALVAAARRGVRVRLLLDKIGCFGLPTRYFQPLIDAGGSFAWFSTLDFLRNRFFFHLRNHRKLQIIDGRRAFVGGMNLGREYDGKKASIGRWRDAQVTVTGEVVSQLQEVFAQDWFFATGERLLHPTYYPAAEGRPLVPLQIIAAGPDMAQEPMMKSWLALLHGARERIWLSAGYFTPDTALLSALQIAGLRGVDVRLLVSVKTEHPYLVWVGRSYYEELLTAGVRIFEFGDGMHHAKVLSLDGCWGMVGSANFDIRSMRLNFELNLLASSAKLAGELEEMLAADFKDSREIKLAAFRQRSRLEKLLEASFRPLSPLL